MATHNSKEIKPIKERHQKDVSNIKRRFKRKGKEFNLHRGGVIPQDYYDSLRDPSDDKYKEAK